MPPYAPIAAVMILAGCTSPRVSPPPPPAQIAATKPSDLYDREFVAQVVSLRAGDKRIATWHVGLRDVTSGQVLVVELLPRSAFFREGLDLDTYEAIRDFARTRIPFREARFRVQVSAPQGTWGGKIIKWERVETGA